MLSPKRNNLINSKKIEYPKERQQTFAEIKLIRANIGTKSGNPGFDNGFKYALIYSIENLIRNKDNNVIIAEQTNIIKTFFMLILIYFFSVELSSLHASLYFTKKTNTLIPKTAISTMI